MSSNEAFDVWAPTGGPWSPWVKPILFASEIDWSVRGDDELPVTDDLSWVTEAAAPDGGYRDARKAAGGEPTTAYVVDVPGPMGVGLGIAFARRGVRPIPLYNAVPGGTPFTPMPMPPVAPPAPAPGMDGGYDDGGLGYHPMPIDGSAMIDMGAILRAMRAATPVLRELALPSAAAPVFLLDADRRYGRGTPTPGRFDNRSISLPTDFPSAIFLQSRGIRRAVLVQLSSTTPQEDLAHTLMGWQEGGVAILAKSLTAEGPAAPIEVSRPSQFRALMYRLFATLGLKRSPLGGFGGTIPLPSSG